jgi:hypothetical protein
MAVPEVSYTGCRLRLHLSLYKISTRRWNKFISNSHLALQALVFWGAASIIEKLVDILLIEAWSLEDTLLETT